jgi:exodeoxyribonuclease VII small subunit
MSGDKIPPDIAKLNFEDALSQLEEIVRHLEDGEGKLDDAIKAYERGDLLKRHCETKLQEAQGRVDKIIRGPDGTIGVEPEDPD